jgi:thioredoxin-like negative regulator of GroEL
MQNVEHLEKKWAEAVFADSTPEILEFFNTLKQEHSEESKKGLAAREAWISLDLLHKLQKILACARNNAETPEELNRINLLEQTAAAGSTAAIKRERVNSAAGTF